MPVSCPEEAGEEDGVAEDAATLETGWEETARDDTAEEAVADGEPQPEAVQRRSARQNANPFFLFIVIPHASRVQCFTEKESFCIRENGARLIRIQTLRPV